MSRLMAGNPKSVDNQQTPDIATRIMERMVRMPPKPHKVAPKPATPQGEAQRRRREKERKPLTGEGSVAAKAKQSGPLARHARKDFIDH